VQVCVVSDCFIWGSLGDSEGTESGRLLAELGWWDVAAFLFTFWNVDCVLECFVEFLGWAIFRHRGACVAAGAGDSCWCIGFGGVAVVGGGWRDWACGGCSGVLGLLRVRGFWSLGASTWRVGFAVARLNTEFDSDGL